MSPFRRLLVTATTLALLSEVSIPGISTLVHADDVRIDPDVVYGHKLGLAMTLDTFTPEQPNDAGVIFIVSGGWYSNWAPPENFRGMFQPLLDKGFTVFAVRHGSSPRFSIPEAVEDVRRSVRFIRHNADQFGIDPQRIGVFGMSAGGHLSLMLGTASDDGDPNAADPVQQVSNRVQAVVAFVAPTDLTIMTHDAPDHLPAYDRFPALALDAESAKDASPLLQVTPDDAPTLLLAGDKDELVPVEHSRRIQKAFEEHSVVSKLVEVEGAGHGFNAEQMQSAMQELVAWFESQLAPSEAK